MSAFRDEIRRRMEAAKAGLVSARELMAKAAADEKRWTEEFALWERALTVEDQRTGRPRVPESIVVTSESGTPLSDFWSIYRPVDGNKTETALGLIAASGDKGLDADEVQQLFAERGQTLHRNYVFNIASRLKQQGKIEQREGRYYVVKVAENEKRSASG